MNLVDLIKEAGIVGAGGAGFPTHVKLQGDIKTLIVNAVECEPLIQVDKVLIKHFSKEIITTLNRIKEALSIEIVVAIKAGHPDLLNSLSLRSDILIKEVPNVYPMGDEVILIREVTGICMDRGQLPIVHGLVVMNLETIYNIHRKLDHDENVSSKYVSVLGEVDKPGTYKVPIGMSAFELLRLTGIHESCAVIEGGVMTGRLISPDAVIKKTTKALIALSKHHKVIRQYEQTSMTSLKRIMSSCSQCRDCTDMCPRHLMGHDVQPHKIMNAMANGLVNYSESLKTSLGCVSCGICELYACHHDLSPRRMMMMVKSSFASEGVRAEPVNGSVSAFIDRRKIPSNRLKRHLNLFYEVPDTLGTFSTTEVKVLMKQHIGVAATPLVSLNETVSKGQVIGLVNQLGAHVHAPISGTVTCVCKDYVRIKG